MRETLIFIIGVIMGSGTLVAGIAFQAWRIRRGL